LKVLYFQPKDFSIENISKIINTLQDNLTSFRNDILLPKDKQNSMKLIEVFNFLFPIFINYFKAFNKILPHLAINQPSSISYETIGSKTETIVIDLISKTSNLVNSIFWFIKYLS
jgi:hypothetical protein